jgi:hypothetical protein
MIRIWNLGFKDNSPMSREGFLATKNSIKEQLPQEEGVTNGLKE